MTRPGGLVFAAALSRYIAFGRVALAREAQASVPGEWLDLIAAGVPTRGGRFPAGHFHTAEELEAELVAAGLAVEEVVGVEGPAGLFLESSRTVDDDIREAALVIARASSSAPAIRDFSAHLLAIARV